MQQQQQCKTSEPNLAQALACVCGTASSHTGICVQDENTANYGAGSAAGAGVSAYKAVVAKCQPANEAKKVTAELLATAISQVESALGNKAFTGNTNNGRYVLGNGAAADCNGGTSSATCIDYTAVVGTATFHKVKWVDNMLQATNELKKAYTIRAELAKMQAQLQAAEAQALKLRDTLDIATITAAHAAETIKPSKRQPKETIESKEAECNTKDKETDCKPPCTRKAEAKDEKKECTLSEKVKEAVEKAAGGIRKGTAAENCRGKLEPECAKDPGCKWQGKEFKDSSFLVHKKLALMALTFVSLAAL